MGMLGASGRAAIPGGSGAALRTGPRMGWASWGAPPLADLAGDPSQQQQQPQDPGAGGAGLGSVMHTPLTLTGQNAVQITPGMMGGGSGAPNMNAPATLDGMQLNPAHIANGFSGAAPPATLDGVNIPTTAASGAEGAAAANPNILSSLLGFFGL